MKFFDDDMDELFNKAGRQYPLKTDPKNWEAVRGALHQEEGTAETVQKNNGWKRLLPLLLLLLIPAVYVFIDKDNINKDKINKSSADKSNTANPEEIVKAIRPPVTKDQTTNTNQSSDREVNRLSYVPPSKQSLRKSVKVEESESVKGGLSGPPLAGLSKEKPGHITPLAPTNYITDEPSSWNKFPLMENGSSGFKEPSEVISLNTPVRSLNQPSGSGSVPNSDKKNKHKNGIYYGVIAAPDLTTIKGQEIKGVGYSVGVIVGYTLNSHWELEGGAMWSRKKYYTDGKYFSKEGAQIPSNIKINWLDGGCEMFEFPVMVRYNLSARKNTFFAGAGLTSYIMKTEDYKYSAEVITSGIEYPGYKVYSRSGDHLFANLQLSGGYKHSLSSKMNLRIEPYLKIPLKEIGIGKMPITSTGLYFSITRDFR